MKELPEVRNQLLEMLEELNLRLDKISNDVKHTEKPAEQDFSEQAVENENNEVLDALGNSTRDEVEKIKTALSRIDDGQYGICTYCGVSIHPDRLQALPYITTCVDCALKLERKQH
jgi:DnaK suppressor protein